MSFFQRFTGLFSSSAAEGVAAGGERGDGGEEGREDNDSDLNKREHAHPDGDEDGDEDQEEDANSSIPEPVDVARPAKKVKREKDKERRKRSRSKSRSRSVVSGDVDEDGDANMEETPTSAKRKHRISQEFRLSVLADDVILEPNDVETISLPKAKKKRKGRRSDVSESVEEAGEPTGLPEEETSASSLTGSQKRKSRNSDEFIQGSFPEVRIEGNSAVAFPLPLGVGSSAEKRKHRRKSGDKKKRKRLVESDGEGRSEELVEETPDGVYVVELEAQSQKQKKQRIIETGVMLTRDAVERVDDEVQSVEKRKRSHKKMKRKSVDVALPETMVPVRETPAATLNQDGYGNGEEDVYAQPEVKKKGKMGPDHEANSSGSEDTPHEKEDPGAMVNMLNSLIRRANLEKAMTPTKTPTSGPILPPARAQTPILPPVPAWKSQFSATPARLFPRVTPTPGKPFSKLVASREVSSSPAPVLPVSSTNTSIVPRKMSQAILPPPRSSTPAMSSANSQAIQPPAFLKAPTPVLSSTKSQAILPPSRLSTPAASGRTQYNMPRSSTPILPPLKVANATLRSTQSQSVTRPPSTPILPPSYSKTQSSFRKPSLSLGTPSQPQVEPFSSSTPQVVIKSRPRASLLSVAQFASPFSNGREIQPSHQPKFLTSTTKAKKALEAANVLSDDTSLEDDDSALSSASFTEPLVPASLPHSQGSNLQESDNVEMSSEDAGEGENEEMKHPSLKALGKRKAVDEPIVRLTKKVRRRRESRSNSDIRQFGVIAPPKAKISPSSCVESVPSVNRAAQQSNGDRLKSATPAPIIPTSRLGPVENHRSVAPPPSTTAGPVISPNGSHASSSTPFLQPFVRASLGFQRRSTPQFTPINRSVNAKSLYSPAVVLPSSSRNLNIEISQSHASVAAPQNKNTPRDSSESPSSAQSEESNEDNEILDADILLPIDDHDQQDSDVDGDLDAEGESSDAEVEEHGSQTRPQVNSNSPPKSNTRRKRRLPTDDLQLSASQPLSKPLSKVPHPHGSQAPQANTPQARKIRIRGLAEEDAVTIIEAVKNYGLHTDMDEKALNNFVQTKNDPDTKRFWEEICGQVPHVSVPMVHNFCRRTFHNFTRGPWSEEEDEELRYVHEKFPKNWKAISEVINRAPEDARVRWRDYGSLGGNRKRNLWDLEEEERLREVHAEYLDVIREELKNSKEVRDKEQEYPKTELVEALVDWTVVSQKMGSTRSRLQCLQKWNSLKEREAEGRVDLKPIGVDWRVRDGSTQSEDLRADQKLRLLRAIRDSGAGQLESIPWKAISKELVMKGWRMAMKVCLRNLIVNVPDHRDMMLQDVVSSLIYTFEASSPLEPQGFHRVDKTVQDALAVKTREKKSNKYHDKEYASLHGRRLDNGEGSSKKKSRRAPKSKERVTPSQTDDEVDDDVPATERTKIRQRMKRADEEHSQEAPLLPDGDDDLSGELRTAWASVTPKGKAKRPIFAPKISQRKPQRREVRDSGEASLEDINAMQVDDEAQSHISNHALEAEESDESDSSESDEEGMSDVENGEAMLTNGFIDQEAEETSDDGSSDSDEDQQVPVISSPVAVKSEDDDADEVMADYSEHEDQATTSSEDSTSASSHSSGSGIDNRSASDEVSHHQGDTMEDEKPIIRSYSSSDSESDSDEDLQDVDEGDDLKTNLQSPLRFGQEDISETDEIDAYNSPTIKVNISSPLANGTTNRLSHIPEARPQSHLESPTEEEDDSDDANEHTITMNGWDQLPNPDASSTDSESSSDEEIMTSEQNARQYQTVGPFVDEEDEILESDYPSLRNEGLESPDIHEGVSASEESLIHLIQDDNEQEEAGEELELPAHPPTNSNTYSLGSAWERTRRILQRDGVDEEFSVSSDDTTSSIPAVAVPKVARVASVEM